MKIILITNDELIEEKILLYNDNVNFYTVCLESFMETSITFTEKYWRIISQIHENNGVFLNSIFILLAQLNNGAKTLDYKRLHTKLLERTKEFLKLANCKIILHDWDSYVKDYLDEQCINYEIIKSNTKLINKIKNIF